MKGKFLDFADSGGEDFELYPGAPSYTSAADVRADIDALSEEEAEGIFAAVSGARTANALPKFNASGELVGSPLRVSPQPTELRLVADGAYTSLGILGTASGADSTASGYGATASGYGATALGAYSTASGFGAIANRPNAFVAGSNNAPINTLWCGKGISNATPTLWSIRGTGGQGTNVAGGDIAVDAGAGTGNALPGTGRLRVTAAGSSGSTEQSTWTDQLTWNRDGVAIAAGSVPATSTSPGRPGQIAWNANYIYICTAANTWTRAALSTW